MISRSLHRRVARIDHHIGLEVENALQIAQRNIQQVADARRQALEEPHMRARRRQLDVAHALAAHLAHRHFHAALVADHAAVLHALVLAAQALPVRHRAKDARAEQAVALRLEGAVVDGLRLGDLAMRPAADLLRRASMMRMASKSVMGLVSSNGFERNKATLLGGLSRCPPRYFPGFFEDPSFPGSGVYRFQEGPVKTADQLSARSAVSARAFSDSIASLIEAEG